MISDLSKIYKKEVPAPVKELEKKTPEGKAPESKEVMAPVIDTPPGLPEKYIEINLKNQPLPEIATSIEEQEKKPEKNFRLFPQTNTLAHVDHIPYHPGLESRAVIERIEQGPRVFVGRAQKDKFEKEFNEKKEAGEITSKAPTLPHADTNKPGHVVNDGNPVYRPGA